MIYVDTSVVLAHLFAEDRHPPAAFWLETLVTSRLLEYELWTRVHSRGLMQTHAEEVHAVLARLAILEVIPEVLGHVREGLPVEVRTLDALHIASLRFLLDQGQPCSLATYDQRMLTAARKLKLTVYTLD